MSDHPCLGTGQRTCVEGTTGSHRAAKESRVDRLATHNGPALEAGPLAGAGTNPLGTSSTDAAQRSAKLSQTSPARSVSR